MASNSVVTKRKRALRSKNAGHARKVKAGRRSTISEQELFAALGEPGKPAPRSPAQPAKA